jgi:hypothetical protein
MLERLLEMGKVFRVEIMGRMFTWSKYFECLKKCKDSGDPNLSSYSDSM